MPTAQINGVQLHYMDIGRGMPVLLLHGFPVTGEVWMEVAGALSSRYRVIVPDFRGFGLSKGGGPFSMKSLASDMHELLVQIKALPCVVGGLSMGGYVALEMARCHPADLAGIMLVDTRAEGDSPVAKTGRKRTIELVRQEGSAAVAEQMLQKVVSDQSRQLRPDVVGELRKIMEQCSPVTIEDASLAMCDREDSTELLPSISVPALVIVGEFDLPTPPSVAQAMAEAMPRAQVKIIPGAGHMSPMEMPAPVAQAMADYLAELHS